MKKDELKKSVVDYFMSDQWIKFMQIMNTKDEKINHIHIYVDTNLNPWVIEQLLIGYFEKIGHPIERKIEIFTSGQILGSGTIHGVEPKGLPHFDMVFRYEDNVGIRPTAGRRENVEYWGDKYMESFHAKFPFKTELTEADKKEIEEYFRSQAWEDYCRLNESDEIVHIHANVETSIHPLVIREYALQEMKKRGWEIEYAVPVAFSLRGQMQGKVVFAGHKPEKMFDIAWMYNPIVTLIPSTKYWLTTENPTYDARSMKEVPSMLQRNHYEMFSIAEMESIISQIRN
ncbi:MAG: hypothetical protein VB025_02395 [Sphaerochaeta sp.]|jgi:hypothetical protein|nr:hypothetical protein [Sphaerochaeta sp.]